MKWVKSYESFRNEEKLDEGAKEWLLAGLMTLASLAGISQTKQNSIDYNPDKIEAAMTIQDKIEKGDSSIIDLFNKADIEMNKKNLEDLKSVDLKKDNVKLDVFQTQNMFLVKNKLKQGYTLNKVELAKSDTVVTKVEFLLINDVVELNFDSDVMFKTAGYEISGEYKERIITFISDLKSGGDVVITGITVESSTDKEYIKMGNQKLSELRSASIAGVLNGIGLSDIKIHNLPEQGPDLYSKDMSSSERDTAREKTSEFRYVKLYIEYEIPVEPLPDETIIEVVNKYRYELVKTKIDKTEGVYKFKGKDKKEKPHVNVVNKQKKTITDCYFSE